MANITGTSADDSLTGTSAADTIDGLAGDDILAGGLGNDTLDGGAGFDVADYFEATGPVMVNLANGTVSGADGNDILISIEDVWGSDFDDTLTGDANDNVLRGQRGNDTLDGGAGYDAADYFEATGPVSVNLAAGTASGADGDDLLIDIEDIWGSSFDDTLTADANHNVLFGGGGDDTLLGGGGDDTLFGGRGISCYAGDDDILDGGAGIDTAVFSFERSGYAIARNADGALIVIDRSPIAFPAVCGALVDNGADILFNIERLEFADKSLAFDLGAGQAAGNTVRIIGAAFDANFIIPEFVGIGLQLFDSGMSLLQVSQLAIGTGLFQSLAGSSSNEAFVNLVFQNVVGVPPSDAERAFFVGLLQGSGGTMTQAELLVLAANADVNAVNINLVGLQQSGVEFV